MTFRAKSAIKRQIQVFSLKLKAKSGTTRVLTEMARRAG